jgi:hypothetical protein
LRAWISIDKQKRKGMRMEYKGFLDSKRQLSGNFGFDPIWMPDDCFDFQKMLIEFALVKGRGAVFADCGLGKTLMQLVWAENVVRHSNGRVLIITPLAVSHQTVKEAEKFGIESVRSGDGKYPTSAKIIVTNYERLHYFDCNDFAGVVCDESSILKNFDGAIKAAITEFMRTRKYRLLCTATSAPNDFIELGTSSEAIGELGFMDMLGRFFKKAGSTTSRKDETRAGTWQFRGHAERDFWRWVCSWSRAIRRPSDLGFSDANFALPELITRQHIVKSSVPNPEYLFDIPARGLAEQRAERSRSVVDRCEKAAECATSHSDAVIAWCYLNREGDMLTKMIPDSVQVSGKDSDERKEECFKAFESGEIRALVTKPTIAGFGLNWQHCHRQTFFPSHSFEQWYQAIRRCWRFGQLQNVEVDVISSEGEANVLANLQRKAVAADAMFDNLVSFMWDELKIQQADNHKTKEEIPTWL